MAPFLPPPLPRAPRSPRLARPAAAAGGGGSSRIWTDDDLPIEGLPAPARLGSAFACALSACTVATAAAARSAMRAAASSLPPPAGACWRM
eukprot:3673791-Prymnesium_polylepis.1